MKNQIIEQWEKVMENPTESYKKSFEFEKEFLIDNVPKNSILLDIGCGTGNFIKYLAQFSKKIIGIDNDKNALNKCKNNIYNLDNARIISADAEKIPFADNYFNIIICMGTTFGNFGETKYKILSEIKRVLRNKGLFIFSIYNEDALEERMIIYKKYWKRVIDKGNGKVIIDGVLSEQFSESEIKEILKKAEFEIIKMEKKGLFYIIKTQINKK